MVTLIPKLLDGLGVVMGFIQRNSDQSFFMNSDRANFYMNT